MCFKKRKGISIPLFFFPPSQGVREERKDLERKKGMEVVEVEREEMRKKRCLLMFLIFSFFLFLFLLPFSFLKSYWMFGKEGKVV